MPKSCRSTTTCAASWRRSAERASGRARRAAGLGQDDARAAGARGRRPGVPAPAAARRGALDRPRASPRSRAGRSGRRSAARCASSGASPSDTRLLVATEGMLTRGCRRTRCSPASARSCSTSSTSAACTPTSRWRSRARPGARATSCGCVVMSATLDAGPVARFLGGCPVVEVAGAPAPGRGALRAAARRSRRRCATSLGDARAATCSASCPGRRDPPRCSRSSASLGGRARAAAPRHARRPRSRTRRSRRRAERKVILATNVAETSLTVEGVTDVVDSGQHKVLRYDAGARPRPSGARADPAGLGGAARGPRRPHRAGPRAAAVGRARRPAAAPRAGDRARRPGAARARRARLGRRPARVRVVRGAARRVARGGARRCSSGWGPAPRGGSPPRAKRCSGCPCTRGSRACCCRRAAGRAPPRRARCSPKAGGLARAATRRRRTPTCSRPRTGCATPRPACARPRDELRRWRPTPAGGPSHRATSGCCARCSRASPTASRAAASPGRRGSR